MPRTSSRRWSATARSAHPRRCLRAIDQVKATGPNEVTITLKEVQSTFLDNLSSPRAPIAIYPAEEAAKAPNQINFIGTGPFRFVEYKPDSHVKVAGSTATCRTRKGTGRDGFAGKKEVLVDSVTFRFMPEAGARNAALEAGEVHLNEQVDGPTAKRLETNKNFSIYKVLPFAFQVIKFNHAQAPTDGRELPPCRAGRPRHGGDHGDLLSGRVPDGPAPGSIRRPPSIATPVPSKFNKADLAAAKAPAREVELQGREAHLHRRQHPPERRYRDGGAAASEGDRHQCRHLRCGLADGL